MDFVVCSSIREGYSTAVTESIILQIPVLTTECSGMREILGDTKAGIIVENSTEGLVDGLRKVLTDASLRHECKLAAIERSKFFSKERTLDQFEKFIGTK